MAHRLVRAAAPTRLQDALAALKRISYDRHVLRPGTREYAVAIAEEMRLSDTVFRLVNDERNAEKRDR
jgi:hypothetical protein